MTVQTLSCLAIQDSFFISHVSAGRVPFLGSNVFRIRKLPNPIIVRYSLMSRLYFTHWEFDSRIGKVEREIMGFVLEFLFVDIMAVADD